MSFQRLSKIALYERPSKSQGFSVETGLKEKPKIVCKDRLTGTWKVGLHGGSL